jgi:competence protein ComEC
MKTPFLPIFCAFAAGVLAGSRLAVPAVFPCLAAAFPLLLLFAVPAALRARWFPFLVLPAFVAAGMFAPGTEPGRAPPPPYATGGPRILEGIVAGDPVALADRKDLVLDSPTVLVDGRPRPVPGRVLLSVREPCGDFRCGDAVRTRASLRVPVNFNNPGGFDYRRHLRSRGIVLRSFVPDGETAVLVRRNRGNPVRGALEEARSRIGRFIDAGVEGGAAAVLKALLIGKSGEIPGAVREAFAGTGTSHVLAVSGLHVGLVAFFAFLLARHLPGRSETLLLRWDLTRISAVFALFLIVPYAFLAGLGIPVVRAAVMVSAFLLALLLGRGTSPLNLLALAGFLVLLAGPPALFEPSFQLSFTAAAALLILLPPAAGLFPPEAAGADRRFRGRAREALRRVFLFLAVSVTATLGTLPLVAFWFHRFSTVTLLANLVVVPVIGFVTLPLGLAMVFLLPLSPLLALPFLKAAALSLEPVILFLERLSAVSWASLPAASPFPPAVAAYYGLLLLGGSILCRTDPETGTRRLTPSSALCIALALFLFLVQCFPPRPAGETLRLTAVDVGQGSSTLVEFPGGGTMLVDGGGFHENRFDVGRYVVAPFLLSERIRALDTVVLSHPHHDHLNGLLYIVRNFPVGEFWTNGEETETEPYRLFRETLRERGIPHRTKSAGDEPVNRGGVLVSFLGPEAPLHGIVPDTAESTANDRSLVLRLSFGKSSFLLPGDIAGSSEGRLLGNTPSLESDVLFVPHHGSVLSGTRPFLSEIRPRIALISVGRDNPFRFPSGGVLARLREAGAAVYRTDLHGAVTVETDGENISVRPFLDGNPSPGGTK